MFFIRIDPFVLQVLDLARKLMVADCKWSFQYLGIGNQNVLDFYIRQSFRLVIILIYLTYNKLIRIRCFSEEQNIMTTFKFNKIAAISAAAFMVASFGAQAATKVIQVSASVDTSLSVSDVSGAWDAPIVMSVNATSDGLETATMTLNFEANDYKDVTVMLQSVPALVDAQNNVSIPLSFKINGTELAQNTGVNVLKTDLFDYDANGGTITGPKNIPLTIDSTSTGPLQSGNYTGTFVLNFELQP